MPKPFCKLRGKITEMGLTQGDFEKKLNKSHTYVSERMQEHKTWSLDDVYRTCDLLNLPYEMISVYFPPTKINNRKR